MANTKNQINYRSWVAALSSASMRSMSARMDGDIVEEAALPARREGGAEAACPAPSWTEWKELLRDSPERFRRELARRRMDSWGTSST